MNVGTSVEWGFVTFGELAVYIWFKLSNVCIFVLGSRGGFGEVLESTVTVTH